MRMIVTRKLTLVAIGFVGLLLPSVAHAGPLFFVGEGSPINWADAIASNNVRPVDFASGPTFVAQQFYNDQVTSNGLNGVQYITPVLTPDVGISDGSQTHQSLVMSWDLPTDPNTLGVAAWEYVYDVDPDLTNTYLDFSLFAPPGVWDVSVELIDINGRSRGWFLNSPPQTWQKITIDPDDASAQGFTAFIDEPLFDITQVVIIRFDEAGMRSTPFPIDPTGSGLPAWNAWNHVAVAVPEPSSLALVSMGILGLLVRRRRRNSGAKTA